MTKPRKIEGNHYPLNYAWGHGKTWSRGADVLLEASIATTKPEAIREAIIEWRGAKRSERVHIDGVEVDSWYDGGAWFHYELADAITVYLHSSGEDAFDTLEYYANNLAEALEKADAGVRITWTEHPHKRDYLNPKASS